MNRYSNGSHFLGLVVSTLLHKTIVEVVSTTGSFEFVRGLLIGKKLLTAGDMHTHFEFGIEGNINASFSPRALQVVRTLNPAEAHKL